MHICIFVSNDLLNDPRVARHAETLGHAGHDVVVLCAKTDRTRWHEARDGFTIHRIRSPASIVDFLRRRGRNGAQTYASLLYQVASNLNRYKRHILGRTIRPIMRMFLPLRRSFITCILNPIYFTLAFWKAGSRLGADVYWTNDFDVLAAGVLCAGFSRILIHDSHELFPDTFVGYRVYPAPVLAWIRLLESLLIKRADRIITVNPFLAQIMSARYHVQMPTVILNVPSAIVEDDPPERATKVVLYQGIYHYHRGLENLIRACEFLHENVKLVLRGYGPNEDDLRRIAANYPNCEFQDPVPMTELVSAARETGDVGVVAYMPVSVSVRHCSPNKLFEYIAAGLPVVGSNLPFLKLIIEGNQIGNVFDPNDPQSIADAINATLADLPRFRRNVNRIQKQYSWQEEQKKLVALVKEITS